MEISDSDEIVDQLNYRGFSFSVYKSEADSCFYTILMGKPVRVCGSNESYSAHIRDLIDDSLGTIRAWPDLGAKLVEFQNGGSLDLKLVCEGRIIKVYLANADRVDYGAVARDAERSLERYLKISSRKAEKIDNRAV